MRSPRRLGAWSIGTTAGPRRRNNAGRISARRRDANRRAVLGRDNHTCWVVLADTRRALAPANAVLAAAQREIDEMADALRRGRQCRRVTQLLRRSGGHDPLAVTDLNRRLCE